MRSIIIFIFLLSIITQIWAASNTSAHTVVIYRSEACGHCTPYVNSLKTHLKGIGYNNIVTKEFVNDMEIRKEVATIQDKFKVPLSMQGHMLVLINDKYLFEGHVPVNLIINFLEKKSKSYDSIVVTQDSMDQKVKSYFLLENQKVKECSITSQIGECNTLDKNKLKIDNEFFSYLLITVLGLAFFITIRQVIM